MLPATRRRADYEFVNKFCFFYSDRLLCFNGAFNHPFRVSKPHPSMGFVLERHGGLLSEGYSASTENLNPERHIESEVKNESV